MKRQLFSTRFAMIATMIGISVGLGNVWRFPYMMGEFGGSAFLFYYLAFTLIFSVPAVMAEWALGRFTRQGPIGAFSTMWGNKIGVTIGVVLLLNISVAVAYYLYIIGNIAYSTGFSLIEGFTRQNIEHYHHWLSNKPLQYVMSLMLIVASYLILAKGLQKGIETLCRLFVPFFTLALFILIIFALQLDGAVEKLVGYLQPDFSQMNAQNTFAALGQAIFSLGLGGTFLVVFGSFMDKQEDLTSSAVFTALGDTGAAVLAGLFIVPTILALDLVLDQGPGLLFSTLPQLFSRMPMGDSLATLFLFSLFMVTFISALAALEVILTGLDDALKGKLSRGKILFYVCLVQLLLISYISYDPQIIGLLDLIFGSGMQILGCMLSLLALSWGLGKRKTLMAVFNLSAEQVAPTSAKISVWHHLFYYWIKWVIPLVLLSVLVGYIYSILHK